MDSETVLEPVLPQLDVRPPPKAVTLLLPVWGYRFVSQFLDFCLPTLLAPGNIPAMAAALPTRLVVLSRESDEELISSHPAWHALQRVCPGEVTFIDDLITDGNHTTTITLAFARAVRQAHEAMTDTCFVFLMSDYLFADGALRTVVSHFLSGASGIVAGNFQIIAEEAAPALLDSISPISRALVLPSRDLIAWSLAYLHPATTANIVNFGLSHNAHTNRLLWRVDENTFIGRFYLIHPIGVRPEVTDFVVGASLDYSFIPEMCPSGNVVTLTDSDDYFVVEMQPRHHEQANLRAGPVKEAELAIALSEWTTIQHRANASQTIVYHAAELPPELPGIIADADAYIARVSALLSPVPQPFRNHPYWAGAIASNRMQTGQALSKEDWLFLLGEAIPSAGLRSLVWRVRRALFGSAPDVTRLHTRWPDYNMPRNALQEVVSNNGRLLLVADQPGHFAQWMTGMASDVFTLEWDRILHSRPSRFGGMPEWYRPLLDSFDACLIAVTEPMLERAGEVIERLGPLMKAQGRISIMILNDRPYHNAAAFSEVFARSSAELLSHSSWVLEAHYIPSTRLRWLIYRASDNILQRLRTSYQQSPAKLPLLGAVLLALGMATYLVNGRVRSTASPPLGLWSSVFLMLRRSRRGERKGGSDVAAAWAAPGMIDPRTLAAPPPRAMEMNSLSPSVATAGAKPGKQTSIEAAYEFAAKLLAGRHDVALYGFDDTDGVLVSDFQVKQLALYDPVRRLGRPGRQPAGVSPLVRYHDILDGPLFRVHDSICSLRPLAHVSRLDEDLFLDNLAQSLSRKQDILILGCPSATIDEVVGFELELERPWAAFGADLFGRIGRGASSLDPTPGGIRRVPHPRTGAQLKAVAERFFECVFLFSFAEGVLHPGTCSAADFVLAVCCSKKT